MNLETTKKAAYLWRDLRKVEDRIEFFKQFVPAESTTRSFCFQSKKAKAPKLEIATHFGNEWTYLAMDDEMTGLVIQTLEVKRIQLLKEIDAL